jgi:hypothetical protein
VVDGIAEVSGLAMGAEQVCTFRATAKGALSGNRVSPYAVLAGDHAEIKSFDIDKVAHSIPVMIEVRPPFSSQVVPMPIYAVAGEPQRVDIQITNQTSDPLEGELVFEAPSGCGTADVPTRFKLAPKGRDRVSFGFTVPADAKPGRRKGRCLIRYAGTQVEEVFAVDVVEGKPDANAVPLDLTDHLTTDVVSFADKPGAFEQAKVGMFGYPADFTPSARIARSRGVPFAMPTLSERRHA